MLMVIEKDDPYFNFLHTCTLTYQLFSVLLLGLAVILFYTVISFLILSEFFDPDDDAYCSTLIECYISVIREGLLDTFGTVRQSYNILHYYCNMLVSFCILTRAFHISMWDSQGLTSLFIGCELFLMCRSSSL